MKIIRVINMLSLAFSVMLVICSIAFAYILLVPLDVLQDWQITSDKSAYKPGEAINLQVAYKKVRNVNGDAYYYLECKNPNGNYVRYPMSQAEGNRPKGSGKAELPLKLPTTIANLPAECRIAVSIDYRLYSFRNFVENNESNNFKIYGK